MVMKRSALGHGLNALITMDDLKQAVRRLLVK